MGGNSSADREGRRSDRRATGGRGQGPRAVPDNPPQFLTLGNHHVQYRHNPGGPIIFYVDRQQHEILASEVQETVKIKNYANLLKDTLTLLPAGEPNRFYISFCVDSLIQADCQLYLAVHEQWNEAKGLTFVSQDPQHFRPTDIAKVPPVNSFQCTAPERLDMKLFARYLKYDETKPSFIPIVVSLEYEVPQSAEETATAGRKQCQFTYCQVAKSVENGDYLVKVIKQRLQLPDLTVFDLEDIYGVMGQSTQDAEGVGSTIYADVALEGEECVICLANERDTTVMPCRHMCLCGSCAEVLRKQTNKCPICRTVIECLMTLKKEKP